MDDITQSDEWIQSVPRGKNFWSLRLLLAPLNKT